MTRRTLWLSLSILLGLAAAAIFLAAPAYGVKAQPVTSLAGDDHPSGTEIYGVVDQLPQHGLQGSWTVDNTVYTATAATHFRMSAGPFFPGACVRVVYDPNSYLAQMIETQRHDKCGVNASQYFIGLVEQVPSTYTSTLTDPAEITATWVISGMEFISTQDTEYETHNGPLAVGACASVRYQVVAGANIAHEIKSEEMYRCLGPVAFNQAFGYLVTYPPDLIGSWVISDTTGVSLTFESTASTAVVDRGYPLQAGACLGVKYYANPSGVNTAIFIGVTDPRFCQGRFESRQPLSKIYAEVETRPTGVVTGTWTLAGVAFTATQTTRVEEEEGPLVAGACAEGKYDPTGGAMLLQKLESEETEDCQTEGGEPLYKLFGVIESMPTGTYTGTWQVSGVTFQATPTTTVQSRHGEFATGAYVKVFFTYDATSGERTAQLIRTHVAPGFGWINFRGRFGGWIFTPHGDQLIVDGKTYQADPAIDAPANLQTGEQVLVNAYQDSGATYITQIFSLKNQVFLPLLVR